MGIEIVNRSSCETISPVGKITTPADQTRFAVRAFQLYFRPGNYSGEVDAETAAILFALLEKYRPKALRGLLQIDAKSAASGLD